MAHFTKDEINEIAKRLGALGVKDSQFKEARSTDTPTSFPVLQEGRNMLLTPEKFGEYVAKNIDLSKVPSGLIPGCSTLSALLDKLYEMAGTVYIENGEKLFSSAVMHNYSIGDVAVRNVEDALIALTGYLFGLDGYTFPGIVTTTQIDTIFD